MTVHKYWVVKTAYWWTVITPRGQSHGFGSWEQAMRIANRAARLSARRAARLSARREKRDWMEKANAESLRQVKQLRREAGIED